MGVPPGGPSWGNSLERLGGEEFGNFLNLDSWSPVSQWGRWKQLGTSGRYRGAGTGTHVGSSELRPRRVASSQPHCRRGHRAALRVRRHRARLCTRLTCCGLRRLEAGSPGKRGDPRARERHGTLGGDPLLLDPQCLPPKRGKGLSACTLISSPHSQELLGPPRVIMQTPPKVQSCAPSLGGYSCVPQMISHLWVRESRE